MIKVLLNIILILAQPITDQSHFEAMTAHVGSPSDGLMARDVFDTLNNSSLMTPSTTNPGPPTTYK